MIGSLITRLAVLTAIIGGGSLLIASKQMQSGKDHIQFQSVQTTGGAGDTVTLIIKARIDKHWHTYGTREVVNEEGLGPLPTTFTLKSGIKARIIGKPRFTKGISTHYDSVWSAKVDEVSGKNVEAEVKVLLDRKLKKGDKLKGALEVEFQMCDTVSCLPPEMVEVPIIIDIAADYDGAGGEETDAMVAGHSDAGATPPPAAATQASTLQKGTEQVSGSVDSEIERQKSGGLVNFFFYAMGIGFLALLTPCVFPMIPITVSFFTKRHEKNKGKGLRDSLAFGLGIISTFTAVGLLASVVFGGAAVQNLAADPWLNVGIGLLFLALAFNLFGAYEIQVPVSIMNRLNKKASGDSLASVWLMGFVFSLTSFTCTVPFVGTLLLSASQASTADAYVYPAVGTLGFATAFALPFVLLSLFPALLTRLPRAGGWMNNLKVVMGFIEIAAAVKFFSNADLAAAWGILPREVFLSIWAGVCLLTALYILGFFEMKLDTKVEKVSGLRAVFAVLFATFTFWFVAGMTGRELGSFVEALLPPENYQELIEKASGSSALNGAGVGPSKIDIVAADTGKVGKPVWMDNLQVAKRVAKEQNKPIFIDFTGFTCTNCRLMEKYVFVKPLIEERFKKFVLVQLFTDRRQEPYITNQRILAEYGTIANPLYVMLRPDGSFIDKSGYLPKYQSDPATFAAFLDRGLKGHRGVGASNIPNRDQ